MSVAVPSLETVSHLLTTSLSCCGCFSLQASSGSFCSSSSPSVTWKWEALLQGFGLMGSREAYLYLPLSSPYCPLPPAPFSSAVLVGFLQPCPTISLISIVCIKLTSHGVGTGLRRRRLYPLMSNYSSASRTLLWPQATAWGTETSSGSLPSPSRYSLQIHLKGTWHILGLTKL